MAFFIFSILKILTHKALKKKSKTAWQKALKYRLIFLFHPAQVGLKYNRQFCNNINVILLTKQDNKIEVPTLIGA